MKRGRRGRRDWKKLHLSVDQTGVILARALTQATGDDARTGLDLVTAVDGTLVGVVADTAYDTVAIYDAARARGATDVVPRSGRPTCPVTGLDRLIAIGSARTERGLDDAGSGQAYVPPESRRTISMKWFSWSVAARVGSGRLSAARNLFESIEISRGDH